MKRDKHKRENVDMKDDRRDVAKDVEEIVDKLNSLDDILAMAMSIENEGQKFYEKHAVETDYETARDLYKYLAKEEAKHAAYMKAYVKAHMEGNNIPTITAGDITFTQSFSKEFTDKHFDELGVLLSALRMERRSEYFYTQLASLTEDKEQREMFDKLAFFECEHYELIDYMIEIATQFRMQT